MWGEGGDTAVGNQDMPSWHRGPSTVEPIAGQTLSPSTDFLQGQRMGQAHHRVKLTSIQGCSTLQAHPAKPGCVAFCQALESYSELPSPGCWALWLPGTQGHLRKQAEKRGMEGLSVPCRLWVTYHLPQVLRASIPTVGILLGTQQSLDRSWL